MDCALLCGRIHHPADLGVMSHFVGQGGFGGTGMGLATLIMPISIAVFILGRPAGPIRKLLRAGAISPETARRARGVGIPRDYVLGPYAKLGVARRLDDGRWFIDRRRDRLVRMGMFAVILLLAAACGVGVWLGWDALTGGGAP